VRKLYVRGDDAGGCLSANLAIERCLDAGVLKNVGVMACGLAFEDAARRLAGRNDACFGMHVCLNSEWDAVKWGPVLPPEQVPNLVDDNGHFLWAPIANHERGLEVEQAMMEVRAQLARLRDAGFEVRYLDEHMGVGWVGGLGEALRDLAREEGLFVADAIPYLPDADATGDPVSDLLARAAKIETEALVVFHPGLDAADMREYRHVGIEPGQVAKERGAETDLLTDPRLRVGLESLGVVPSAYV
jgi:predicted glycoside hydrolase/deacetylase ChbG (UPF0249 family)